MMCESGTQRGVHGAVAKYLDSIVALSIVRQPLGMVENQFGRSNRHEPTLGVQATAKRHRARS
jgi:hypothetical protein